MVSKNFNETIDYFRNILGRQNSVIIRHFFIGRGNTVDAVIIYIKGFADKNVIDRDILNPLMLHIKEPLYPNEGLNEYLYKTYISMSDVHIEKNINSAVSMVNNGKSVVIINGVNNFLVFDTRDGKERGIQEPPNESAVRGSRVGFVEDIETNISLLRKKIKDGNLVIERFIIGTRSKTQVAILYISDIADMNIINEIKFRITSIDMDTVPATGTIEQMIEKYPYSIFPQAVGSERPDIAEHRLMEGRAIIILEGTPYVLTLPALFTDFFQSVEDYYERTLVSSFVRILRYFAVFLVITLPAIYLTFIKFNAELIPIKFVIPLVQSRHGIPLPPLLEILAMEIVVEFLREGGLRLPTKIAQTLSVVGGFIIGSAALQAKLVSPSTLVVVGASVIGTFVIPNYEMSLAIRLIRFPMLLAANLLGILGIAIMWYIIILHMYSLDSFGVPYFQTNKYRDYKDLIIRTPLWKMNNRPESIPNNNPVRQTDFRKKFWRK